MQTRERSRIEHDTMGEMEVPESAYYGAQTRRAEQNFPISDLRFPRRFIQALGLIKVAAAITNLELELLDADTGGAIVEAAREVASGQLDSHFPLDIFQTGSGTSMNINANEVIAHRAEQLLSSNSGKRTRIHPNDEVNKSQSSNDVIPTAIHLAALIGIHDELLPGMEALHDALESKAREFWPVVKTGRTHLQDATPIRLGQVFRGFTGQIERGISRIHEAERELSELALGGTAVGTGVNMPAGFAAKVIARMAEDTGLDLRESDNHFQAQSTLDNAVAASGELRTVAVSLMKIANDIRWMGSGPRAGIGELTLPAVQPGSSIMPGKVNPVIAESVAMVCAQVIGNDVTVAIAGQSGNFELNVMMPVLAYNLLQSISLLSTSASNFAERCIRGLEATEHGPEMVEAGLMLATTLAPEIGYERAAALVKHASESGQTIREVARAETDLSDSELDRVLNPAAMTEPGNPPVMGSA